MPGGKAEEDDKDDSVTATREAEEEIGLHPSLVDVVAFLEPFLSQVSTCFHGSPPLSRCFSNILLICVCFVFQCSIC